MQTSIKQEAGTATISLVGRFDFNTHRDFRGGL
jgi:HptB-dependent secretion and biofilm anti anti-sigma factor